MKDRRVLGKTAQITGDILFLVILAIALAILLPTALGYRIYEVKSDSMEPEYPRHALIYVKETDVSELKKGDVISFDYGTNNSEVVTHRIVKVKEKKQAFQTKGDANDSVDTNLVPYANVIGKVIYSVPKIGGVIAALQGMYGILLVLALLAFCLLLHRIKAECLEEEAVQHSSKRVSFFFLVGLCLVIFSGYQIIKILVQYQEGKDEYTTVAEEYTKPQEEKTVQKDKSKEAWETRTIDFDGLRAINPDVIGWLAFDGGEIDYPILQAEDDKKYLNTTFEGNENPCGSIFLEAANSPKFTDSYSLVYGHNMKNRTMFGNLRNYKTDDNYWKDHAYFTIYTPKDIRRYAIFYFADVSQDSDIYTIGFQASDLFEDFLRKRQQESYVSTGVQVGKNDKIVALSTCSSEKHRFVVMGKLQEIKK